MRNKEMITALGLRLLLENENYKTGDFHQALLDIAYDDWQKHNRELLYEVFPDPFPDDVPLAVQIGRAHV